MRGIRKLAAVCCGFSAAVFLAHYLLPLRVLLPAALLCALAAILCRLIKNENTRLRLTLVLLASALGLGVYLCHYAVKLVPLEKYYDSTVTVSARVTDFPEPLEYSTKLYLVITEDGFHNTRAVIYDYNDCIDGLQPGDEVNITLKLKSAAEKYNEETDINISKGLYIIGYPEDCTVTGHWRYSFLYFPKTLGNALRETIRETFPEDSVPFLLAHLTGYKTDYYDDDSLNAAMSLAGMSHVVAVSGMHVAFLVGFIQLIAGKNRKTALVCIALVWLFVIMVGAPPSAVRAGFMQSVLLMAPVFRRENDYITSLSAALAIILAANPFAAGSIGLQLSFAAMAGILIFGSRIYAWFSERCDFGGFSGGVLHYAVCSLVSSLSVTVFTWPLMAIHFGYVSLISPIVNVLSLWAVSLIFCGGYLICALALLLPKIAAIAGGVLAWLVRYLIFMVKTTANLPMAALYVENIFTSLWVILIYAALTVYFAYGRKHKMKLRTPLAVILVGFILATAAGRLTVLRDKGTIGIMNVGNGECIALTEQSRSVVIDCGAWNTYDNAGKLMSCYLHGKGLHRVDYLVLTHVHRDHANGVVWLMTVCNVKTLVLPDTAMSYENDTLLSEILTAAEKRNIEVLFISEDTGLQIGGIDLDIYAPIEKGDKNERGLTLTASVNGCDTLILGDVNKAVERALVKQEDLEDTDVLVVAHHGSKYSTSEQLLEETQPDIAVISVGYNSYGHPTQEVLDTLQKYHAEIRRTDEDGRIIIKTRG